MWVWVQIRRPHQILCLVHGGYCAVLQVCDDVMETAWSAMWNVTDETPVNCERFLNAGGMFLFLKCKVFNSSEKWRLIKIGPTLFTYSDASRRRLTCCGT